MTSCWNWQKSCTRAGYGQLVRDGIHLYAHRLAWEAVNGTIPEGMGVLHSCDNPPCVNPDHLFLGTDSDNSLDKARKGRGGKKLLAEHIPLIRQMYANGYLQREIAEGLGVSQVCISGILTNKTWRFF